MPKTNRKDAQMTVKELSETVKHLIGVYDYFDTDSFISSANTALGTIYSETSFIGRGAVYLSSPKILHHVPYMRHIGSSIEKITLQGKAYSMRLFGKGVVNIIDGGAMQSHSFDGWGVCIKGTVSYGGEIRFTGMNAYTVQDITLFSEYEGTGIDDIPVLGERRKVKIESYIPDFSRALSYPADESGAPIEDVTIENGYIICPKSFSGEVFFSYKKRPPKLRADVPDFEIPISAEAESALGLLTAAYLVGESESEAAEFFLREYKRNISRISSENLPSLSGAYFDTTGWA